MREKRAVSHRRSTGPSHRQHLGRIHQEARRYLHPPLTLSSAKYCLSAPFGSSYVMHWGHFLANLN